jgi:phosphatidylglycerophosphate synthase
LAARLARWRVTPGGLTLAAFACAVGAMVDISHGHLWLALALLAAARIFDGLDGPVARRTAATERSAYLDLVLSLTASAGIPFAFALALPDRAPAALFLELGLVVNAAAAIAQVRLTGFVGTVLHRAGSLIGKSELFLAFALACLFPDRLSIIAYAVGILCFAGAGSRVAAIPAEPA